MSSVQNPSRIPLHLAHRDSPIGLFETRNPNIWGSIIPNDHQPTGVLNTADV